jgi:arabinofuranosyltransferase
MKHRAREAEKAKRGAAVHAPPQGAARRGQVRLLPAAAELLDPRAPYLVPLLLLLATRIAAWIAIGGGAEDAYITYRYAHHLAAGNGLVYNPGERVMGFSSPLWTVWNALGYLLTKQPLLWSRTTSLIADTITLLAFGRLLRTSVSSAAAWCFGVFFAAWPTFAALAMSGMECSLMLAWIALGAAAIAADSALAAPVIGALALTRPEGIAAAAVLAVGLPWRRRLVAAGIAAAGLAAVALYYGTIVPQSLIAKASVYGAQGPWAARYWWDWLVPFALGRRTRLGDVALLSLLTLALGPAFLVGVRELWRARKGALAFGAAGALVVWLGYAFVGAGYFWWYLGVPLGGIALVAAVGLPRIVHGRALYVSLALTIAGAWAPSYQLYVGRWREERASFGNAASFLREHARPGEAVLLEPIGMIGYSAPLRVIDEVGLVSPRVAARRQRGPGWYADVVAEERPQWLVVRYGTMRTGAAFAGAGAPFRGAAERDSTLAAYEVEARTEEQIQDQTLMILRRVR